MSESKTNARRAFVGLRVFVGFLVLIFVFTGCASTSDETALPTLATLPSVTSSQETLEMRQSVATPLPSPTSLSRSTDTDSPTVAVPTDEPTAIDVPQQAVSEQVVNGLTPSIVPSPRQDTTVMPETGGIMSDFAIQHNAEADASACDQGPFNPLSDDAVDLDDDVLSWGVYCEGQPTWIMENVTTPSLDGTALRCGLTGGDQHSNILCYRNLLPKNDAISFSYSLSFQFSPPTTYNNQGGDSIVQAIEFTMNKYQDDIRYEWALQWNNVGSPNAPQWRYWNPSLPVADRWVPIDPPITQELSADEWHTLSIEGVIVSGNVHYRHFVIDGQQHDLNLTVPPDVMSDEIDRLAVGVQLDGAQNQYPYNVFVDYVNIQACPQLNPPENLAATGISPTTVNLNWTHSSPISPCEATHFQIARSPDGATDWENIDSVDASQTSYQDAGLICNTDYHYRVRAYRDGDEQYSDYSNVDSATTSSCSLLTADLGITQTDNPDPLIVGDILTYTLTVTNNGPDMASRVSVANPMSLGVIAQSATPDQGACEIVINEVNEQYSINCDLGILANVASTDITIEARPVINESIFNEATVSSPETDDNPSNDSSTEETTVEPPPGTRVTPFAGQDWYVKDSDGAQWGPGDNYWEGDENSVWADEAGRLHLTIRKVGNRWYSSEVYTVLRTGYGMHRFYVESPLHDLDRNVVLGLFLYQDDEHEIDFESARWGGIDDNNAQFVIQPFDPERFLITCNDTPEVCEDYHSTHEINWGATSVDFRSIEGYDPDTGVVIREWTYSDGGIPQEERHLRVRMNLWLDDGLPPSDRQEVEIIIASLDAPHSSSVADLEITKTDDPDPIDSGELLTYTLNVENKGDQRATNVVLTDTLPTEVAFVSATPNQGNCVHNSGTITCTLGVLMNGDNLTVPIEVDVGGTVSGIISNTASVTADEPDPDINNNSTTIDTTVYGPLPPPNPLLANAVSDDQINLTWTDNSVDEWVFMIEHSLDGVTRWIQIDMASANQTSYQHGRLDCGSAHYYRVRAYRLGDDRHSSYTNIASATVQPCPPLIAPSDLSATGISRTQIEVCWTNNSPGETTAFHIERSPDGVTGWTHVATVPGNWTCYQDDGLSCGTVYHYRVCAFRGEDGARTCSIVISETTQPCPEVVTNTAGLYREGVWQFRDANSEGPADVVFAFGPMEAGWKPLVGDWDGDGVDGIGLYRDGVWMLRNATSEGSRDTAFYFGPPESGWQPVIGDWNGDDVDSIGLYKDGVWMLRNENSSGPHGIAFYFGAAEPGWTPIAGDWNSSGVDTVGLYRDSVWYLHNSLTDVDRVPGFLFGPATGGWTPVVGNWNEDGTDTIGLYRESIWRLRNSNNDGPTDVGFNFGDDSGWQPVASYRGGVSGLMLLSIPPAVPPTPPTIEPTLIPIDTPGSEVTEEPAVIPPTPEPTATPIPPTDTPTLMPTDIPPYPEVTAEPET